jgi:AraC family transcriptional regulator
MLSQRCIRNPSASVAVISAAGIASSLAPPSNSKGGLAPWQVTIAKDFMDTHLERNIQLSDVAEKCLLSSSHFSRSFRVSVGVPPRRWLIARRIDRAKKLLSAHGADLANVALDCGFADQSHFTRAFSALVGATPGRWRARTQY